MAKGKQRAWNNLDGLYRDVEDARRHHEHGTSDEGAKAFERWLELIDIAMYALSERDNDGDDDMEDDADDGDVVQDEADGPNESGPQLVLPGTARMDDDVPRGTSQRAALAVPLVGTDDVTFVTPSVCSQPSAVKKVDKRRGT